MGQNKDTVEQARTVHGLEMMARTAEPMLRGASQTQLAFTGLMTRRARAYQELPQRTLGCRTLQDVTTAQTQFWREASADYAEVFQKLARAWSFAGAFPGFGQPQPAERVTPRDYISFQEPPARETRQEPVPTERSNGARRHAA